MSTIGTMLRAIAAGLAFAAGLAAPAAAQSSNNNVNLFVMSDDADPDTVPRNNRIFNRVQLQLSEYLNTRGFNVYDETSASIEITPTGRVRRRDSELIEIARAVPAPIDAMVIYQIYASARVRPAVNIRFPEIRIAGRVLNVRTGQFIAAFEVGGFRLPALPNPCFNECLLEVVGDHSRTLATDLGAAIATKLEGFLKPSQATLSDGKDGSDQAAQGDGCDRLPTDFNVELKGFSASDISRIEGEFVSWPCYKRHRVVTMTDNSADFFYSTSADSARITRNFRLMLELAGLTGQVSFSGNRVIVAKIATR